MATCVLRVGMPDRPGALGAVASRIGAVHADVIGIEILTRADGRAMDEIIVEVDGDLLPLLLSEIEEVDGVEVEEVRTLRSGVRDRRLDAYLTASALLEAHTPDELLAALAVRVSDELDATWVTVLDTESELVLASTGRPPSTDWLVTEFRSCKSATASDHSKDAGTSDRVWADLDRFDAALCAARPGWDFSDHETQKLVTIARIADARWSEVATRGIGPRL
ncbi:MAG: ACT domain-containing protein [Acidimicrobiales bacterium]